MAKTPVETLDKNNNSENELELIQAPVAPPAPTKKPRKPFVFTEERKANFAKAREARYAQLANKRAEKEKLEKEFQAELERIEEEKLKQLATKHTELLTRKKKNVEKTIKRVKDETKDEELIIVKPSTRATRKKIIYLDDSESEDERPAKTPAKPLPRNLGNILFL